MRSLLNSFEINIASQSLIFDCSNNLHGFESSVKTLWKTSKGLIKEVVTTYFEMNKGDYADYLYFIYDYDYSDSGTTNYLHFKIKRKFLNQIYIHYTKNETLEKISIENLILLDNMSGYTEVKNDVIVHSETFNNAYLELSDYGADTQYITVSIVFTS